MKTIDLIAYSPFAAAVLAFLSTVLPARLGVRGQAIWAFALLLAASRSVVFLYLGGNRFLPNFPAGVIWAWYLASTSLYLFLVLRLFWWTRRGRLTLMPALAVALAAWGVWEGYKAPAVHEVELSFANLPQSLDGYRIAQISDLHCSSAATKWRTEAIVATANAAKPDLICLTGDYVDGLVSERAEDMKPLCGLRAKDGVYCVTGNHEGYRDAARWRTWYLENNFQFLENEWVRPRPGLTLGGMGDTSAQASRKGGWPDVRQAFRNSATNDFRVLLVHRPKLFRDYLKRERFDLQLSGHTHGGIAPGIDRIVAKMNNGFVHGEYRVGDAALYVSRGVGLWAGFPLRFFNPAQIVVITLRRR